jgi:hypothetical protein
VGAGTTQTFRLEQNSVKIVDGNPLVKISAYCEDVEK